jgi:hypothetical protein
MRKTPENLSVAILVLKRAEVSARSKKRMRCSLPELTVLAVPDSVAIVAGADKKAGQP